MNNFIVIGNPVEHSLSPKIHQLFAEQFGMTLTYEKFLSDESRFENDVRHFFREQGRGMNVTVPFKTHAFDVAAQHSERAKRAGACNTLMRLDDGQIFGDNTDGIGLVRDLMRIRGRSLADTAVLILGSGGAVRGILGPLLDQHLKSCCVASRSQEKLAALQAQFPDIRISDYYNIPNTIFDVIINATSAGLSGELPPLPTRCYSQVTLIYDCMYGEKAKLFLDTCRKNGAGHTEDGMGMLVEQAAESFYLWHGVRPKTNSVIQQCREV